MTVLVCSCWQMLTDFKIQSECFLISHTVKCVTSYLGWGKTHPWSSLPPNSWKMLTTNLPGNWIVKEQCSFCWLEIGWEGQWSRVISGAYPRKHWLGATGSFSLWKGKPCSRVRLSDPVDDTIHGILQARIQQRVAFPFSRGSSQSRDRTQVSCIAGGFFTSWATREAYIM